VNTKPLENIRSVISYNNLAGAFSVGMVVDSEYTVKAIGNTSVQPHTYVFDFDTLDLALGPYRWLNEQDVQSRWDFDGFRIMHGTMKRGDEACSITGVYHPTGDLE